MAINGGIYRGTFASPVEAINGVAFNLKRFTVRPRGTDGLSRNDLHSSGRAFLAIAGLLRDSTAQVHGSGIMVGPGICITAAHVLDEILELDNLDGLAAISPRSDGRLEMWELGTYTRTANFDIAIVSMRPRSDVDPYGEDMLVPTLHARVPREGERVTAIGFRAMGVDPATGRLNLIALASEGVVTQNHPLGRDRVMMPGPCFEMGAAIVGCMSGGPVFDEAGRLIGLVSSSPSGEGEPRSCASLLWPAVAAEFQPTWPPAMYPDKTRLRDCAPMVEILNGENATVAQTAEGDFYWTLFDPASFECNRHPDALNSG